MGGVQGFFSEYSLFLIVLFAAVVFVFLSIILALGVYICKVRFEKEMPLGGIHIMASALKGRRLAQNRRMMLIGCVIWTLTRGIGLKTPKMFADVISDHSPQNIQWNECCRCEHPIK